MWFKQVKLILKSKNSGSLCLNFWIISSLEVFENTLVIWTVSPLDHLISSLQLRLLLFCVWLFHFGVRKELCISSIRQVTILKDVSAVAYLNVRTCTVFTHIYSDVDMNSVILLLAYNKLGQDQLQSRNRNLELFS